MTSEDRQVVPRGALLPALLPWICAAVVDAIVASGGYVRPAPAQYALEFGLLAGLGWAQWTFGRGWLRSPLLAAAVLVFFGVIPHAPKGALQVVPYLAGVVFLSFGIVRVLHARVRTASLVGALVSAAVVLAVQAADWYSQVSTTVHGQQAPVEAPAAAAPAKPGGVPIVVISVDTLRADAASSMESMRRLSARGATWRKAMSTSSWTLPALASLQTGRMPADHGAGCLEDSHCQGISDSVPTLAEELRTAGWTTGAVVANPWAGAGMGFSRGFGEFVDPGAPGRRLIVGGTPKGPHGQDDARTVDAAIEWLRKAPERGFYLWVHLMGPHMPYLHSPIDRMRRLDPVTLRSSYPSSDAQKAEIRDAYADEVAYTDGQVGRLLDELERKGVVGTGVVVFTSDHGEEFWEHGGVEHGHSHHAEVTDIPLALVAPELPAGERQGVASLADVAPTIRAIAGLPADGADLREGIDDDRAATAWGGIILRHDCSARDSAGRLIVRDCSRELSSMRFFDLERDPEERLPSLPEETHPLVGVVRGIDPPARSEAVPLGSDRLRALGYLQ